VSASAVHPSMACLPGIRLLDAAAALVGTGATEPAFGRLDVGHAQLVPQSPDELTPALCDVLQGLYPATEWRLHANVRCQAERVRADLSNFDEHRGYFARLAQLHKRLGASAYTAHAGRRANCSLQGLADAVKRCEELFDALVGVEGLYPDDANTWLVSCWHEYEWLLGCGCRYALDLSHLKIVATREGRRDDLVAALLSSPSLLEVHVSDNDGRRDAHDVTDASAWWFEFLELVPPGIAIFTEGNHKAMRRAS
jgi:hypothetical protein